MMEWSWAVRGFWGPEESIFIQARPSGGGERGATREAALARRLQPAGVCSAVFAGEHRVAPCVVGCCLVCCLLCVCLIAGPGWMHGGRGLYKPTPAVSGR